VAGAGGERSLSSRRFPSRLVMGHPALPTSIDADGGVRALRFGAFELDLQSGELRRSGVLVHLQQQPAKVLTLLARRSGELVTREEIQRDVWGGTFVDFEGGLNFCVKQIRNALGDQADTPRYLETLPRRGYRFLAPVQRIPCASAALPEPPSASTVVATVVPSMVGTAAAGAAILALVLGGLAVFRPASAPPAPPRAMLAVLPFENLSPDPAQEFFSDGLTEEMITQLARLRPDRLGVIARTSANVYKKALKPVAQIGRELGVDYVVEGSVRREGDRLKVTAQLVQVKDQTHLWADSYERRVADSLAIQDDVARRIVGALQDRLLTDASSVPPRVATPGPQAYDAYLKGRYQLAVRRLPGGGSPGLLESIAAFEEALALDPAYAAAWAGLASARIGLVDEDLAPAGEGFSRARAAAERALALDEGLAEAHLALATVALYHDWDWSRAGKHYTRALALDPGRAASYHAYAGFLSAQGRHEEAIGAMETARRLDPLSAAVNGDVGWYFYMARRYDDAIASYRRTLELEPRLRWVQSFLVDAYAQAGRWNEAREEALRLMRAAGASGEELDRVARGDARDGVREFWKGSARRGERSNRPDAEFIAQRYAQVGDGERALDWLRKAVDTRARWVVAVLGAEPSFDPLRPDERFRALRQRVGLPSATRPSS
jgi:TolB-like protein/DNA-binding winged helix-turn-helix (wHTH) protein/tetratricopeptide (TPR) repeat protein